jgi:hypothetical protein
MRPSEKFEAKAAGQKGSEAWFSPRRERFWPTTQASGFAAGRNRAGYLDRLLCDNLEQPHLPLHPHRTQAERQEGSFAELFLCRNGDVNLFVRFSC